jgi:hypothetical protein
MHTLFPLDLFLYLQKEMFKNELLLQMNKGYVRSNNGKKRILCVMTVLFTTGLDKDLWWLNLR